MTIYIPVCVKYAVGFFVWFLIGACFTGFISRVNHEKVDEGHLLGYYVSSVLFPFFILMQFMFDWKNTMIYIWNGFQHPK